MAQIITMLLSNKMGAKKGIENDLGKTVDDYAERVRNPKDKAMVKSLLERI